MIAPEIVEALEYAYKAARKAKLDLANSIGACSDAAFTRYSNTQEFKQIHREYETAKKALALAKGETAS